jgi:hypothetical protein
MKNLTLLIFIAGCLVFFACKKDTKSERFLLLTGPTWTSDSLLYNGLDASNPGGQLVKFKGDAKFREDGTGFFGQYIGTWRFTFNETELVIESDSLQVALTANIAELTKTSLKITTSYPNLANPSDPIDIRMTFMAK